MTDEDRNTKNKIELAITQFMTSDGEMNELNTSLIKIEKLLSVIRDISTKTDLLSLNASIEAVRAGQLGKGFAVVADEVARLAEKTQDSISEIETAVDAFKDNFEGMKNTLLKTKCILNEIKNDTPAQVGG
jgi:methyl-accepting chemotaxis protein